MRSDPSRFFIGIDPNGAGLVRYSHKATRKPAKGGLPNVLYVLASLETLPSELTGVASHVSVIFPWGSLLRAVAGPDAGLLAAVRALCQPGAHIEVVFGYDCAREAAEVERLGLPQLSEAHLRAGLPGRYRDAGFDVVGAGRLSHDELRALPSTWAKRLAFGRPRDVWRLRARAVAV